MSNISPSALSEESFISGNKIGLPAVFLGVTVDCFGVIICECFGVEVNLIAYSCYLGVVNRILYNLSKLSNRSPSSELSSNSWSFN